MRIEARQHALSAFCKLQFSQNGHRSRQKKGKSTACFGYPVSGSGPGQTIENENKACILCMYVCVCVCVCVRHTQLRHAWCTYLKPTSASVHTYVILQILPIHDECACLLGALASDAMPALSLSTHTCVYGCVTCFFWLCMKQFLPS